LSHVVVPDERKFDLTDGNTVEVSSTGSVTFRKYYWSKGDNKRKVIYFFIPATISPILLEYLPDISTLISDSIAQGDSE